MGGSTSPNSRLTWSPSTLLAPKGLSPRITKLANDFVTISGELRLPTPKLKAWLKELAKVPQAERLACAAELMAMGAKLDQASASKLGAAQLFFCAASLLKKRALTTKGWGAKRSPGK